jgi:hypothetical protein
MDATNKFIKFAAQCEEMAKSARGDDEKSAWHDLALRWRRCAETNDSRYAALLAAIGRRKPRSRMGRLRGVRSA